MNYDEAFLFSSKWIKEWYNFINNKNIEYDDYFQNCAVSFYENKAKGKCVAECLSVSKTEYVDILHKMIDDYNTEKEQIIEFRDDRFGIRVSVRFNYSVKMPNCLRVVADLIVRGFTKDEICKMLDKSVEDLDDNIEEIRKIYRKEYFI